VLKGATAVGAFIALDAIGGVGLAAGHPTQVPLPQVAGAPGTASSASAPVPVAAEPAGPIPSSISPYVLALGGLAAAWVVVEAILITRRRRTRRRTMRTDGQ
jgi:hypothetical protein